MVKKFFLVGILFLSVVKIFFPVFKNRHLFKQKFNPKYYENKYNNSQYVIPQSKTPISDEELLAYAGYKYIKGLNPILINADHPPLGKYIIGFFTVLTNNHRTVSLFFALANILVFSLLIYLITKSSTALVLGIFFISLDTMFIDQIIHSPILDIIQLFFLLLYFFIFLLWLKKRKFYFLLLGGVSLGLFSSIKIYFPSLIILFVSVIFLWKKKYKIKKIILFVLITTFLAFVTYSLTYLKYFLEGNTFRSFLGIQKWIFLFWQNNSVREKIFWGNVFTLILFNRWKIWWGNENFINYENWSIFWPIFLYLA